MNKVIQNDCIGFLESLQQKPRLILTDPPYGMNYKTNIPGDKRWNKKGITQNKFDHIKNDSSLSDIDYSKFFESCFKHSQDDAAVLVFCNDKAAREWSFCAEKAGFEWKGTLYWNKRCANGGDVNWPFINIVEQILCLTKGNLDTYSMFNKDGELKKRIVNVFDVGRVSKKEYVGHPTQKPIYICEQLIRGFTKEREYVVDPFCGSGTTLLAAKYLNRNFDGCDIDEKFVNITKKRLSKPHACDLFED